MMKRFIAIILCFTFLSHIVGGVLLLPSPVLANSHEIPFLTEISVATGATAGSTAGLLEIEAGRVPKEVVKETKSIWVTAMKYAVYTAYIQLLNILTTKMIAWINGEEGSRQRLFVDWQNDLQKVADNAGGAFVGSLTGMNLCQFSPNLNIPALLKESSFAQRAECKLGDIGRRLQDLRGEIESGDWTNWIRLSQEPANNPYALFVMAKEEKLNEEIRKTEAAKNEALAGGGFMSVRKCTESGSDVTNGSRQNVRTGGDEVRYLDMTPEELKQYNVVCEVTTPGNIVQGFASKASLGQYEQFNAAVASLVANLGDAAPFAIAIGNAIVNRVITFGFTKAVSALTPDEEEELKRIPDSYDAGQYPGPRNRMTSNPSISYFLDCDAATDPACTIDPDDPMYLAIQEAQGFRAMSLDQLQAIQIRSRATVDLQNYIARINQLVGGEPRGVLLLVEEKQRALKTAADALTGSDPNTADAKTNAAAVLTILETRIAFYEQEKVIAGDLFNKLDTDLSYILKTGPKGMVDTNGIPGIQGSDDPALDTDGDGTPDAQPDLTELGYVNTLKDRLAAAGALFTFFNNKITGSPSAYDTALADDNSVVQHAKDFIPPPAAL